MRVDQRGARMLEACECWDRLSRAASSSIGRIAVNGVRTPYVIPVNFSVMDIGILVPLGPAWTSFHLDGPECTFEVDYVAVQGLAGWSVVVEGTRERCRTTRWPVSDRTHPLHGSHDRAFGSSRSPRPR